MGGLRGWDSKKSKTTTKTGLLMKDLSNLSIFKTVLVGKDRGKSWRETRCGRESHEHQKYNMC